MPHSQWLLNQFCLDGTDGRAGRDRTDGPDGTGRTGRDGQTEEADGMDGRIPSLSLFFVEGLMQWLSNGFVLLGLVVLCATQTVPVPVTNIARLLTVARCGQGGLSDKAIHLFFE